MNPAPAQEEHGTTEIVSPPEPFAAVGRWYGEFEQTSDEEVVKLLSAQRPSDVAP